MKDCMIRFDNLVSFHQLLHLSHPLYQAKQSIHCKFKWYANRRNKMPFYTTPSITFISKCHSIFNMEEVIFDLLLRLHLISLGISIREGYNLGICSLCLLVTIDLYYVYFSSVCFYDTNFKIYLCLYRCIKFQIREMNRRK